MTLSLSARRNERVAARVAAVNATALKASAARILRLYEVALLAGNDTSAAALRRAFIATVRAS